MRVFAYLRVSTKEQLDGGGFERQSESIKGYCAHLGWMIARTFKDQQSGGTEFDGRSGLHEILSLAGECSALGVDIVVVENASRIARDLMVQEIFLAECRKKGIKVFAADSGEELVLAGADPTRKLIRQILGALAEWEKSHLVLKLQAGRRRKARETGQPCGGPKPYGQTVAERAVIADIMLMRKRGDTFLTIGHALNTLGYPTPVGQKYWTPGSVHRLYHKEMTRRSAELRFAMDNDQ
jgi:DNA invertase Pin-like site-specific DNA recombinase